MDKIVWDEAFSVGVEEIDADHQQIAVLINLLAEHVHQPSHAPVVGEILTALSSYTAYHFQREEKHLVHGLSADPGAHLRDHRHFQSILQQVTYGAALGRIDLGRVFSFLVPWWSSHILDQDMELKTYAANGRR